MLDSHLIVTTRPIANKKNILYFGDYRVTVLSTRLFRLEKSEKHLFRDEATQSVWFRDAKPQEFRKRKTDKSLVIKTKDAELHVLPNREDCFVKIDGKKHKLTNDGNLLGTYRTLDCCEGSTYLKGIWSGESIPSEISLGTGVVSKTGVALFDDANSLTLLQNGEVTSERGDGSDEYIFAFGDDYRGAVKALYEITGYTPMIPRFALGNWWSRYHAYSDREYLRLLTNFSDHDTPLTIATVDMDWHYSDEKQMERDFKVTEQGLKSPEYAGKSSLGWTGYTWNKYLFPDYKEFLRKIKEKNLHITLNIHPADGVRFWEDCYEEMCQAMGMDPKEKKMVPFKIADSNFINHYFKTMHKPYEKDGVDFWWIDWQQGMTSDLVGLDPLWSLNHYHYLDNAKGHPIPLILSRYSEIGSHRYPLGFSGDATISWKTLDYLPYFTATASNVGYTWWSHDIGGHMMGINSQDLFVRFLQYGVLSPINRLHCTNMETVTKEPWCYGGGAGEVAMKWLRFRHALIPYLYSASRRTHKEGLALIEPLYYEWKNKEAFEYTREYLFGGELLVAPVTQPKKKDGFSRVKVWLPEGVWVDIFTGDRYVVPKGGKKFTALRDLQSVPVFIPAGGVLPLSKDKGNSTSTPKELELQVFEGSHSYELFEDGSNEGTPGEVTTKFQTKYEENETSVLQSLIITSEGDAGVIPEDRILSIVFKGVSEGTVSVTKNGVVLPDCEELHANVTAKVPFEVGASYVVTATYPKTNELQKLKEHANTILTLEEGNNNQKYALRKQIFAANSVEEIVDAVKADPNVQEAIKLRILEVI